VEPFRRDLMETTREFVRSTLFLSTSDADLVERVAADMSAAPPDIAIEARHQRSAPSPAALERADSIFVAESGHVGQIPSPKPLDDAAILRHMSSGVSLERPKVHASRIHSTDPRDALGGRDVIPGWITPQEDRESVYQDRTLSCRDCSEEFTFSSGEQAFFASKGLLNDPQRCPSCRAVAKRARTNGGPREFHAAICGSCGGQAMVPFAPRNDRPVYCSSCFDKVRAGTITVHATV
jgi:CxxC-x17-CxxC domain-containing protein